jgi:hypothetical protein
MEVGGQHHALAALPLGNIWYPIYTRLGEPPGWFQWVWESLPPPGFDPSTVQLIVSRYTGCALPALMDSWNKYRNWNKKLIVSQLDLFLSFYGVRWSRQTGFTSAVSVLSQVSLVNPHTLISWRSIYIIVLSTLRYPDGLIPSGIPTKTLYAPLHCRCCIYHPYNFSWFDQLNSVW